MKNAKQATNGHTSTPPGAELLDAVAAFFREYLVCDDHQLTLLTLWAACTRFQQVFSTAPYLDIRSIRNFLLRVMEMALMREQNSIPHTFPHKNLRYWRAI